MPLRLARSNDASNEIIPRRVHLHGLRGLLECRKARWCLRCQMLLGTHRRVV
jgi:hypothetical protein